MDNKKFEIIKQLMDELSEEMQHSPDELSERLGRKKPDVAMLSMNVDADESPDMEGAEEMMGKDLDGDMEMGESPEHVGAVLGDEMESPEDKLKRRLMKLRG